MPKIIRKLQNEMFIHLLIIMLFQKFLKIIRQSISEYIKYNYKIKQIGASPENNRTISIDETLIMHAGQK